jgi:hypothetical protein
MLSISFVSGGHMFRLVPAVGVAIGALLSSAPVFAADYGDALRGSLPANWGDMSDEGDPLDFEFGVRYFYSMGYRSMDNGGNLYELNDTSHALEVYGRIDDNSTGTYLKGHLGYSAIFEGTDSTPLTGGAVAIDSGHLAYANADFGYLGFGEGNLNWGPFIGYQYGNTSSSVTAANETVNIELHMLRLGVAARGEMADNVDVAAEVAVLPYGLQSGSAANGDQFDATLFGVSGELMFGFHPTDSMVVSVGGRATYLTDDFGAAGTDHYTDLRVGGLLGVGYSF